VGPPDDVVPCADSMKEPNLTKGIVSRLWDWQLIDFPQEKPGVLVHNSLVSVNLSCPLSNFSLSFDLPVLFKGDKSDREVPW
jgi:hypothetical protein